MMVHEQQIFIVPAIIATLLVSIWGLLRWRDQMEWRGVMVKKRVEFMFDRFTHQATRVPEHKPLIGGRTHDPEDEAVPMHGCDWCGRDNLLGCESECPGCGAPR